jgi:hypothetical protein
MLSQHIEGRVLDLVERVVNGGRIEDFRVECKATWPLAARAARQIAAHANAARREPILWIIGLDEDDHQVRGASDVELADWWAQVLAALDEGIAPGLTPLVVPVGAGQAVVVLYMTTDRAPYVVKRQNEHGPFEREVPWRDGNRTRSAHRHELVRLLLAAVAPPDATAVELLLTAIHHQATTAAASNQPAKPERIELVPYGTVFFGPPSSPVVVLPAHLMTGLIDFTPDQPESGELEPRPFTARFSQRRVRMGGIAFREEFIDPHPLGVDVRLGDVYVAGPGTLEVAGSVTMPFDARDALLAVQQVGVQLTLPVAGGQGAAVVSARLKRVAEESSYLARWASQ